MDAGHQRLVRLAADLVRDADPRLVLPKPAAWRHSCVAVRMGALIPSDAVAIVAKTQPDACPP